MVILLFWFFIIANNPQIIIWFKVNNLDLAWEQKNYGPWKGR